MNIEDFRLERWMSHWETRVQYDIAESGIQPISVDDLLAFLPEGEQAETRQALLALPLGYSEARGTQQLREAIAITYEQTGPDNILITTGAIEANFLLFQTLLDPVDHVITIDPAYQQVQSVPAALGAKVSFWKVRADDGGFRFDLEDLERLVTGETKLIALNTPHNPTGAILAPDDLRHIAEVAASVGAMVVSDEAYRWLELPGGQALAPPARNLGDHAISVGTFSKPFGLPGLRIGWIAGPEELVARCWALRDYITLSPGKLNDALALLAMQQREAIVARNRRIVAANLATADEWFAAHPHLATWTRPQAGLLALLRYVAEIPSLELADKLAADYSVMLAPGSAFGFEGALRIGIGQDPDMFTEGLRRTADCLNELRPR